MDTTKQIHRFPFRSLDSGKSGGSSAEPNAGFRSFPYKPSGNHAAGNNSVETIEKEMPKAPIFSEKELYEVKQQSYEEGYAKGYSGAKSLEAEIEKQIQVSLADITIKLAAIGEAVKTRNNQHIKELTSLVIRVARKVAGTALKNEPYSEIEKIISESLPLLFDEPTVTISVNNTLVDNVDSRIRAIIKNEGFKNHIEINGNQELSPGSCEIQWKGGGLRSNKDELWVQIEKLCENV